MKISKTMQGSRPLSHPPRSSEAFRREHDILFQANICSWSGQGLNVLGLEGDFLDLNHNGDWDVTTTYDFGERYNAVAGDPALTAPYQEVQDYAARRDIEVVEGEELAQLRVCNKGWSRGVFGWNPNRELVENERSLQDLVSELKPLEAEAKWAIDTRTKEFLIYLPKNSSSV